VAEFVLGEQGSGIQVGLTPEGVSVRVDGMSERLPADVFVEAAVGRLPDDHPLDGGLKNALRCLA
jgi:hypothetical protein